MTEEEILRIKNQKKDLKPGYIRKVDQEWREILCLFSRCRYDLSKIRIVRKYE